MLEFRLRSASWLECKLLKASWLAPSSCCQVTTETRSSVCQRTQCARLFTSRSPPCSVELTLQSWWCWSVSERLRWRRETPRCTGVPCSPSCRPPPRSGTSSSACPCHLGRELQFSAGDTKQTNRWLRLRGLTAALALLSDTVRAVRWGGSGWSGRWSAGAGATGSPAAPRASAPEPQAAPCGWCRQRCVWSGPRPVRRKEEEEEAIKSRRLGTT